MAQPAARLTTLVPAERADARSNHFNIIRLAMALAVIWSHCFAIYWGTEGNEPVSRLLAGRFNAGNIGVRVFFIISGFLVLQSYVFSRSKGDYFTKRVKRIFPAFIMATAICTFVVVPLHATAGLALVTPQAVMGWAWRALTLQEAIPGADAFAANPIQAVNGALWSIRYEFWCYIGIAILGVSGLYRRPKLLIAVLVGVMAGKAMLDVLGKRPGGGIIEAIIGWPYAWFSLAPCFLVGMVLFFYGRFIPRSALLLSCLLAALVVAARWGDGKGIAFDLLFPFTAGYAIFYLAFSRDISLPDAARHGDFSYGAYLYGFPIQQMVKAGMDIPFALYVPLCMALSVLAGFASWNLVEKHFIRRRSPRAAPEIPALSRSAA